MKLNVIFLLASLWPGQAHALKATNGILPGSPSVRQLHERFDCNSDNVLRGLRNPKSSVAANSFLLVNTQTTTSIKFDTITENSPTATTTVLCAATVPTTDVSCGIQAYGYVNSLISEISDVSPTDCHVYCLANPSCKSFQSQIFSDNNGYCNIYSTSVVGNVFPAPGAGYFFYDRDCQEFRPAACSGNPNFGKRSLSIPGQLLTLPANRITSACSCLITSALPATTSTTSLGKTIDIDSTVVVTSVSTHFDTVIVGGTATYISTAAP